MLHLHILRHAKTESNDGSKKDFDRKIVAKGENQTKEMAAFFENSRDLMIRWAAFYADCMHSVQPVTDGYRLTMTYSLLHDGAIVVAVVGCTFETAASDLGGLVVLIILALLVR